MKPDQGAGERPRERHERPGDEAAAVRQCAEEVATGRESEDESPSRAARDRRSATREQTLQRSLRCGRTARAGTSHVAAG